MTSMTTRALGTGATCRPCSTALLQQCMIALFACGLPSGVPGENCLPSHGPVVSNPYQQENICFHFCCYFPSAVKFFALSNGAVVECCWLLVAARRSPRPRVFELQPSPQNALMCAYGVREHMLQTGQGRRAPELAVKSVQNRWWSQSELSKPAACHPPVSELSSSLPAVDVHAVHQ